MPHIEAVVARTLAALDEKSTPQASESGASYDAELSGVVTQHLHAFDGLSKRASEALNTLDADLAADEERLRTQLTDMQSFRQNLTQWIDQLAGTTVPS